MAGASSPVSHVRVLVGLVAGAALGSFLNWYLMGSGNEEWIAALKWVVRNLTKPIGQIFLNLLFMAIIPLVFASLAVGVTRLGGTANVGRVGAKTLAYFIITTAFAAVIGLCFVNLIRPGDRVPEEQRQQLIDKYRGESKIEAKGKFDIDTLTNVVPRNPLEAFLKKDMLAVIFTSILVGIALTRIAPDRAKLVTEFLEGVNQITDFIIRLAMSLAPIAVFALIFSTTAELGYQVLLALGAFVGTVLAGLAVHQFVVLPILVATLGGMNPLIFFAKIQNVMLTAFSTSSSSATLPAAMQCAENELNVPAPISKFVLPLSASMNHNGTALFEGVTVMFLAQVFNVNLTLPDQLLVLLMCVLTATGMAGVPGGSLPLIGLILTMFGVPAEAIFLVLGVDRLLDMCRTTVNVTADMTTALFVARTERDIMPATAGG